MTSLSIRWKFALWAAGLVAFALIFYSGATLLNLYEEQIEAVDLELTADGKQIAESKPFSTAQELAAEIARFEPWFGYAIFDDTGVVLAHSPGFSESIARLALSHSTLQTARDHEMTWRLGVFKSEQGTVVVGYDLAEVHEIIRDLVIAYALSMPVAAIFAAVGGWWVSKRALGPVRDLTLAAENVQAGRLDRRVPVPDANDEIQRLAIVLNAMLGRLEKSFEQAQRFAADASHELRTPLTIMRGEIENFIRMGELSHTHQMKLVSFQEEIDRLSRITENLLLLARLDAGSATTHVERIDLTSLLNEVWEDAELLATAKGVTMEKRCVEDIWATADSLHIRRALLNLLDNAVKFNLPGGQVSCELTCREGKAFCSIGNTGPGIPNENRPLLFQRFFRADESRGSAEGHGLGLSLSREIARAYGGDLEYAVQTDPTWTCFVFSLPLTTGTN